MTLQAVKGGWINVDLEPEVLIMSIILNLAKML